MSKVVLITGMSGVGKTTLSDKVIEELQHRNNFDAIYLLDGDITRKSLYPELGFTKEDREKNLDRATWLANYLVKGSNNILVLMAYIAPYPEIRHKIQKDIECNFAMIYLHAPLDVLKERDPKGLYKKAMSGEIKKFTGITDPYIPPTNPDLSIDTSKKSIDDCMKEMIAKIYKLGLNDSK